MTEQKYITASLTTDLTAAYDTVDSTILLDKLQYYGIKGIELTIFKIFMNVGAS